jgi:biotin synthase
MKMTRADLRRVAANFARTMRGESLVSAAAVAARAGATLDPCPAGDAHAGDERLLIATHGQGRARPALVLQYTRPDGQAPMMLIVQPGDYVKVMLTADAPLDGYDAFEETPDGFMQDRAFPGDQLAPVLAELERLARPDGADGGERVRERGRELELVCAACGGRAAAFRWGSAELDSSRALAFAALGRSAAPVDDHLVYFDQRGEQPWTFSADDSQAMAACLPRRPRSHARDVIVRGMPELTLDDVRALHDLPLPELLFRAQTIHRQHHRADEVQLCTLLSVKTGGCPEDCAYCPQSAHYETPVSAERSLSVDEVLAAARAARAEGATRFCMGAAWREVKDGPAFDAVLQMVRGVRALGLEACTTLGMLTDEQAQRLADAGLTAYNHNLDTSRRHYASIISTRTYDDRLRTLEAVRRAGITVCSGGIIGMGESIDDRCEMLRTLASLEPQPESVPINTLVVSEGTPLASQAPPSVDPLALVRMVATARLLMPRARVRLSAGRLSLTREAQVLCFLAGANSIFYGEKLLTTGNPDVEADRALLDDAGLKPAEVAS